MDWGWLTGARRAAAPERRWVVLDVESSGLDAARDRLLAIAAVGLRVDWAAKRLAIDTADSFEVVLQQQQVSERDNILLHGIGEQRQRDGVPPAEALRAFAAFAAGAPLLAFHAAFDQTLVSRAAAAAGLRLTQPWIDIEHLCAATHPHIRARALDEWMAEFGIVCAQRHQAAADTWAECELMLRIWPRVAAQCDDFAALQRLARHHRWLPRG